MAEDGYPLARPGIPVCRPALFSCSAGRPITARGYLQLGEASDALRPER
jgi:hypothetical protein